MELFKEESGLTWKQLATTEDVVTISEIEGEILDVEQVRSSVARRLGMDIGGLAM